jgi:hypothetical protein
MVKARAGGAAVDVASGVWEIVEGGHRTRQWANQAFVPGRSCGDAENWRCRGKGSRLFVMGHMGLTGHISHIGPIRLM